MGRIDYLSDVWNEPHPDEIVAESRGHYAECNARLIFSMETSLRKIQKRLRKERTRAHGN